MSPCVSCGTTDMAAGTLELTIDAEAVDDVPHFHASTDVDICRECARRLADGQVLTGRIDLEDHL